MKKILKFSLLSFLLLFLNNGIISVLAQQESNTGKVWDIAYLALGLSTLLGIFVVVLLVFVALKYRQGSSAKRKKISHSTERNLEIIWVSLSLLLVIFATGVTYAYSTDIQATQNDTNVEATYYVLAKQFVWTFFDVFPNRTVNTNSVNTGNITMELNKKYELIITSDNVIHSFFVYDLGIKQDAVPNREVSVYVTPTMTGVYEIRCAQYCGSGHYSMAGLQFIHVIGG